MSGSAGASMTSQVGLVIYLVAGSAFAFATGNLDAYAASGLVVALVLAGFVWLCWKRRACAFLVRAALALILLFATPTTFSLSDYPLVIWEAGLGATLMVLVTLEGVLSYVGTRKPTMLS
ncbi:MAG: hypothetical protein HY296_05210 [Thaumarchaeota archaeon]|nr:hypothetical protein [Nitrososphaerota archaeon]